MTAAVAAATATAVSFHFKVKISNVPRPLLYRPTLLSLFLGRELNEYYRPHGSVDDAVHSRMGVSMDMLQLHFRNRLRFFTLRMGG